jgi:hypothetical protein
LFSVFVFLFFLPFQILVLVFVLFPVFWGVCFCSRIFIYFAFSNFSIGYCFVSCFLGVFVFGSRIFIISPFSTFSIGFYPSFGGRGHGACNRRVAHKGPV